MSDKSLPFHGRMTIYAALSTRSRGREGQRKRRNSIWNKSHLKMAKK